jgi:hypothetical protein
MTNSHIRLAEHYLICSGIAAIEIGAGGEVAVREIVDTKPTAGAISICCRAGDAGRLAALAHRCSGDQAAVARQLRIFARDLCIGLSPYHVVVDRAFAAVEAVSAAFKRMQEAGEMRDINQAFKAARAETPSLRYQDYLQSRKLAALEAMAAQMR